MKRRKDHAPGDVRRPRAYVEAMLGLEVYAHKLYMAMKSDLHEGSHEHRHA